MGRLQRGMDRDLTKKMTSVDDTFCKDASVCKSARFQTDKKPFTTHFVECLILEELVHATWWWHLPLHPPARSPLHKFLYKMHSRVCKTTLNRTVHSCLQNHKSANQHFMGALRFSPLQKAKSQVCKSAFHGRTQIFPSTKSQTEPPKCRTSLL